MTTSLTEGKVLLHYRLVQPIGEGGMGVVWRATDTTLGRDVAIKVLPDAFVADPERVARFEREARLLASLNHPHIASIYGFHAADGVRFLVMELVEGESLAARIERGAMPVVEALPIALQIAAALEHAHERGVVHRDLKPGNVVLARGGEAKVLDFGLAKAYEGDPSSETASSSMMARSPTITSRMTAPNTLLGTAAYMAPEQARGQTADRRADIWAFGVLVMEMLTGCRLFEGETTSDTLAAVLREDPDWTRLPRETPPRVQRLLKRCLTRDPKQRLRDIGEARIAIEQTLAGVPDEASGITAGGAVAGAYPPPSPHARRRTLAWVAVSLLVIALIGWAAIRAAAPKADLPLRKFRLVSTFDPGVVSAPQISPDGTMVVFVAGGKLWVQALSALEPEPLDVEGTPQFPFWSQDGEWIGYMSGSRILKVPARGGKSQVVTDARSEFTFGSGGSWTDKGTIVFSLADSTGLFEVSPQGGDPKVVCLPASGESDMHQPFALPGDRGILFSGHRRQGSFNNIQVWAGGKKRLLLELKDHTIGRPIYAASGHILYARSAPNPGIWAVPFSLSRLEITGEPFLVVPDGSAPSVSRDGTLCYLSGQGEVPLQLAWWDRGGKEVGVVGAAETADRFMSVAPDGNRVVRSIRDGDKSDIWILDGSRGTRTRLTFEPGTESAPVWSPDGSRILYSAVPPEAASPDLWRVLSRPADGGGRPDTLAPGFGVTVTRDGRYALYDRPLDSGTKWDLMVADLKGGAPALLVRGNPRAMYGAVDPSGRYAAYMSVESGVWEVFLTRFPSGEGKWQVSAAGGQWPHWNARGDRLCFVEGDEMMEVDVELGASPVLGKPRRLFTRPATGEVNFLWISSFDMSPDGSRFLILRPGLSTMQARRVTLTQNWLAEFRGKKR